MVRAAARDASGPGRATARDGAPTTHVSHLKTRHRFLRHSHRRWSTNAAGETASRVSPAAVSRRSYRGAGRPRMSRATLAASTQYMNELPATAVVPQPLAL